MDIDRCSSRKCRQTICNKHSPSSLEEQRRSVFEIEVASAQVYVERLTLE